MSKRVFVVALLCVLGFIVGNGVYSLYNANALSYLSNDSAACNKWLSKAYTGLNHAYHFTFDKNVPANFTANADTKAWVKENCIRCHGDYAHNPIDPTYSTDFAGAHKQVESKIDNSLDCLSCHHSVGHLRDF